MSAARRHNSVRRGFTLVELLVVVGIVVLLASIAIPAMRPALEGSRIREAARSVNVYLGWARNRALETGRPHGVLFERFDRQPDASIVLRQVEVPPPYAGDLTDSVVRLRPYTGTEPVPSGQLWWDVGFHNSDASTGSTWNDLVQEGDLLQLNFQGDVYRIGFPVPLDRSLPRDKRVVMLTTSNGTFGPNLSPSVLDAGLPFQVFRQPVPSAAAPLRLARGAVVDLAASGPDSHRPFLLVDSSAPADPSLNPWPLALPLAANDLRRLGVIVMFSPNGSVDRVTHFHLEYDATGQLVDAHYVQHRVIGPLHFLVGRWERMADRPGGTPQAEDDLLNWQDGANLWVTLNAQTGLVTVAELNADQLDAATNTFVPSTLDAARQFAREAQISKGGR
jgi:prepilin-type N-terminal cleavage/methylation domain-containing protein